MAGHVLVVHELHVSATFLLDFSSSALHGAWAGGAWPVIIFLKSRPWHGDAHEANSLYYKSYFHGSLLTTSR
jgi:hypothetical protein